MSNIFCGIGKMPKKSRRGTMQECAEKGQVRYYGIKKVDKKALEFAKDKNTVPETREALIKLASKLKGLIRRNKTRCETTKNMDEKDNYCKIWKDAEKKLRVVAAKYKKLMEKREKETQAQKAKSKKAKKKKVKSKKVKSKKSKNKKVKSKKSKKKR
jgi:hypothetical protein